MAQQLYSAYQLVQQFGVKSLVYGGPGMGKTPIIATAPAPILLPIETGLLSLAPYPNVPCWPIARTSQMIDEFFRWFFHSSEANQFHTLCIDSVSQMCQVRLDEAKLVRRDPRKAYGDLFDWAMPYLTTLYYMQRKHMYLICKQEEFQETAEKTITRPSFPGQALGKEARHLYDLIMRAELSGGLPGLPPNVFRTKGSYNIEARDRSGKLAEFEPTNLTHIISKILN